MIKFKKLPENILELMPVAKKYLSSHPGVIFAYLFGSLAKSNPLPLSDVDIAVYLAEPLAGSDDKLDILGNLIDILKTDEIDFIILNTAELSITYNILKYKKILSDRDPYTRHIFESLVMRKYFDFSIRESALLRRRYFHG